MNRDELDKRLEAYYAGESTLQDEQWLMHYFNTSSEVPEVYKEDQALFIALAEIKVNEVNLPPSLDHQLEAWMDEKLVEESYSKVQPKSFWLKYKYWGAVAASILLLVGGVYLLKPVEPEIGPCLAVDLTFEESVELTEKALLAVSAELNKGSSGVNLVKGKVKEVNRIMDKLKVK